MFDNTSGNILKKFKNTKKKWIKIGIIAAAIGGILLVFFIVILTVLVTEALSDITIFFDLFGFKNTNNISEYTLNIDKSLISEMDSSGFSEVSISYAKAWFKGSVDNIYCKETCCITVVSKNLNFGEGTIAEDYYDFVPDDKKPTKDASQAYVYDLTTTYCGLKATEDINNLESVSALDAIGQAANDKNYRIRITDESGEYINPKIFVQK